MSIRWPQLGRPARPRLRQSWLLMRDNWLFPPSRPAGVLESLGPGLPVAPVVEVLAKGGLLGHLHFEPSTCLLNDFVLLLQR